MIAKTIPLGSEPAFEPLSQFRVLVTRPVQQQNEFISEIEALGGRTLSKPLLAIEELKSDAELAAIKTRIQRFAEYDIAIFVSTNAARYGYHWIDNYWPQLPLNLLMIAIGPSTAKEVTKLLRCKVSQPEGGFTSEDVLDMPELQAVSGSRVAIFRGAGGRELLASALRDRGATVDYFEVYTRQGCNYVADAFADELLSANINVMSANSTETVDLLKANLANHFSKFSETRLLVPSDRVAKHAGDLGFSTVISCAGASSAALVTTLLQISRQQQIERNTEDS